MIDGDTMLTKIGIDLALTGMVTVLAGPFPVYAKVILSILVFSFLQVMHKLWEMAADVMYEFQYRHRKKKKEELLHSFLLGNDLPIPLLEEKMRRRWYVWLSLDELALIRSYLLSFQDPSLSLAEIFSQEGFQNYLQTMVCSVSEYRMAQQTLWLVKEDLDVLLFICRYEGNSWFQKWRKIFWRNVLMISLFA